MGRTSKNFPDFSPSTKYRTYPYIPWVQYHSVSPLVRIGTPPPPLPQASVSLPRKRVKGWGGTNSDDWRISLALCLLCAPFWPGAYDLYAGWDEVRGAAGALTARPLLRSQTGHPWRSVAGRPWRAVAGRPWRASARRPFQLVRKSVVLRPWLLLAVFYQLLVSVCRWLVIIRESFDIRMSSFCDKMRAGRGKISFGFSRSGRWCTGGLGSTFSFHIPE
jgi:hypothetical protein